VSEALAIGIDKEVRVVGDEETAIVDALNAAGAVRVERTHGQQNTFDVGVRNNRTGIHAACPALLARAQKRLLSGAFGDGDASCRRGTKHVNRSAAQGAAPARPRTRAAHGPAS
jgi:hypothetical protein